MYKHLITLGTLIFLNTPILAEPLPEYWSQHNQEYYESGRDYNIKNSGSYSAFISSRTSTPKGTGEVWQAVGHCYFTNKKAKLSVFLKTLNVTGKAGIIFRVITPTKVIRDQMQGREITGSTPWKEYYSIIEIPENCVQMSIGFILEGSGTVYADDFKISKASSKIKASSSVEVIKNVRTKLENLGFEK